MPDKTEQEKQRRREQVGLLWARGMRSPYKIAAELGVRPVTVLRDLVILRKWRRKMKDFGQNQETLLLETMAGYLSDIQEINEEIQKAKDKRVIKKVINGGRKVIIITKPPDYGALCQLFDRKFEARSALAEIYDLFDHNAKKNLFKNVVINNVFNIKNDAISDEDLTRATKRF